MGTRFVILLSTEKRLFLKRMGSYGDPHKNRNEATSFETEKKAKELTN